MTVLITLGGILLRLLLAVPLFFWQGFWASTSWAIIAEQHGWPTVTVVEAALICSIITALSGTQTKAEIDWKGSLIQTAIKPIIVFALTWLVFK